MKNKYSLLAILFCSLAVDSSAAALNLKLFIEGYYFSSGLMTTVLLNANVCNTCTTQVDTIVVELHDTVVTSTVVASFKGILLTNGTISCGFPNSVVGNSYWIAVKHRSTIQTWSAAPVMMSATTSYDFSTAASQAYGNNMIQVDTAPVTWAFYTGDDTQDGNIDQIDYVLFDYGNNHGLFGYYAVDFNGDGNVDLLDYPVLDANICTGIYTHHP